MIILNKVEAEMKDVWLMTDDVELYIYDVVFDVGDIWLGGGFKHVLCFTPYLGKIPILTHTVLSRWVGSTINLWIGRFLLGLRPPQELNDTYDPTLAGEFLPLFWITFQKVRVLISVLAFHDLF